MPAASSNISSADRSRSTTARGEGADQPDVEVTLLQRELGRARQKIANLDRVDPATGLLRFGYFQELLRRDLGIARREGRLSRCSVRDRRVRRLSPGVRLEGRGLLPADDRRASHAHFETRRGLCARYDDSTLVAAALGQAPSDFLRLADQITENVHKLGLHNPRAKRARHVAIRAAVIGCPAGLDEDVEGVVRMRSPICAAQRAGAAERRDRRDGTRLARDSVGKRPTQSQGVNCVRAHAPGLAEYPSLLVRELRGTPEMRRPRVTGQLRLPAAGGLGAAGQASRLDFDQHPERRMVEVVQFAAASRPVRHEVIARRDRQLRELARGRRRPGAAPHARVPIAQVELDV